MTLEDLRAWGVTVEEGLHRCLDNEGFYLQLVDKMRQDAGFDALSAALEEQKWGEAFEASHRLKGGLGNLALTPLYDPMCELCELLRPKEPVEYQPLAAVVDERLAELRAM